MDHRKYWEYSKVEKMLNFLQISGMNIDELSVVMPSKPETNLS